MSADPDLAGIDTHRLVVAAHELAHALVFRAAGIEITDIRVLGTGSGARGYVRVAGNQALNKRQARQYLVAVVAGREGDLRWCDQHGLDRWPDHVCADDFADLRKMRREFREQGELHRGTGTGELRAEARLRVRTYWPRITRLAPRLARRGSITV